MRLRRLVHHLVAHPLRVLAPGLGDPLHDATAPDDDAADPALEIVAGVAFAFALLAVPELLAAVVLALVLRRVAELGR